MKKSLRERSPLIYVLIGLIPYSKPNLLLTYRPNQFFRELEKISKYKQSTLRSAHWRAQRQGLVIKREDLITLTAKGRLKVAPFVAKKFSGQGQLMIIFDIPEDQSSKRQKFRQVLKEWQFKQIQKSVWSTNKDYRDELMELIKQLNLDGYVQLYESSRLFPK